MIMGIFQFLGCIISLGFLAALILIAVQMYKRNFKAYIDFKKGNKGRHTITASKTKKSVINLYKNTPLLVLMSFLFMSNDGENLCEFTDKIVYHDYSNGTSLCVPERGDL